MYTLKLKHHFDAAHKLLNYKGACANLHGHRWVVEVEITTILLKKDMVIDFKLLKDYINQFDHTYINDKVEFNPTAENLAQYLHQEIRKELKDRPGSIKITIWESPEASVSFTRTI